MSELITRTARLTPYTKRPRQASGYVTAYTHEPAPDDPASSLGNLFIVIEVLSSGRIAEEVVDIVIETIGQDYYQLPAGNNADDERSTHDLLNRFETSVKRLNTELSRYIDQGNAAWVGKMSAIIAIQAGDQLHLAQTGSAEAFLARGRTNTRITASQTPRGPQANKTFGAITSGTLDDGDRLLLATPALIHQLPLARLRSLMTGAAAATMINEIGSLLESTSSAERVAALAIEVMTPEHAALQLRSEAPDEVVMAGDESLLEVAKQTAAPLAQTALSSSVKIGRQAKTKLDQAKPTARKASKRALGLVRHTASTPKRRRAAAIALATIALIGLALVIHANSTATLNHLLSRYRNDAATVEASIPQLSENQASVNAAVAKLEATKSDLEQLIASPHHAALDHRLASADLPSGAPRTLIGLEQQINTLVDQAEHVERKSATNVVSFASNMPLFGHLEVVSGRLVAMADNGSKIVVIDPATGKLDVSQASTSKLGTVVATGLNSVGDGVYLYTSGHQVWLYKPAGDSLTQESLGTGSWPNARAIASFNGNIYLAAPDGTVYKSLRTLSGYSPPAASLTPAQVPALKGASAMTVDGSIYIATPTSLTRYLGGIAQTTVSLPTSLNAITSLREAGASNTLVATDRASGRTGLFRSSADAMIYSRQVALSSGQSILDAVPSDDGTTLFVLTAKGLLKISL